jgi:trimeric autotransporter adhesin
MLRTIRHLALPLVSGLMVSAASAPLAAQSATLLQLQAGAQLGDRFKADSGGGFVAYGLVKDAGSTSACASQIPAMGAGTRFMWYPCRGSVRFGRVPAGQTNWDDANMHDFSFAGGDQVVAKGLGSFAYGEQVTVSGTVGVGFGYDVTVSGTAGFAAGANNKCSGFACVAIGFTNNAAGEGSVAIGYRNSATGNYTMALGYRASNNGHKGTFAWGDFSTTDSVRNQADNEFRIRAAGGVKLRTGPKSNDAPGVNGNTGCDLPSGSGSWSCASSRYVKENVAEVDGQDVLEKLHTIPVTTWNYIAEGKQVRHMGPFAQDFYSAFQLGTDSASIGMIDINGVNLAAIKALEERTAELKSAQAALEAKSHRLDLLEARLARLEKLSGGTSNERK